MKITKMLLVMFLAVAAVSCNKDDNGPEPFTLSNANISGTYKITSLNIRMDQTFTINGTPIQSVTTVVGDTFQVNTVLSTNGTYASTGNYRITTTVVTNGGEPTTETSIITANDTGTFTVNSSDNTISIPVNGTIQTYDVVLFNSTQINLQRNSTNSIGGVPTTTVENINLVRA